MLKPLKEIKVVELTIAGAGPSCGRILHDFGTENILVEPTNGTVTRVLTPFDYYTAGKQSIVLNTKSAEGYEALCRIIKDSDVFLANYRAKGLRKMKLSYEDVKTINPNIIYASLSGFGDKGPIADAPGNNVSAFYARGGVLHPMSQGDILPYGTIAFGDIATGMSLALGVVLALYNRKVTGEGTKVSSSLLETAYFLNHDPMIDVQKGGKFPKTRETPKRALVNSYKCKDDHYIYICIADLNPFIRLMKELGREDVLNSREWNSITDTMDENAPAVVKLLDAEFAKYTADEALEILNRADCSAQQVMTLEETLKDEQAWANDYLYHGKDSRTGEDIIYPAMPVRVGDDENDPFKRGPRLGEHSVSLLKKYGYTDAEIQKLIDKKVTIDGSKEDVFKGF